MNITVCELYLNKAIALKKIFFCCFNTCKTFTSGIRHLGLITFLNYN